MYAVRLCSIVTVVELLSETFVSLVEIRPEDIGVVLVESKDVQYS